MAPAATARPEENSGGGGGDTEVVASTSSTTEQNRQGEVEANSDANATNDRSGNKKKGKSRAQQECEELADHIINFAEKEEHPVDLELAALGAKIKRKLPDLDDQDDLMDQIKACARAFFQNKRRAKTTTPPPPPGNAAQRNVVHAPPPPLPPLHLYGQQQEQQQQGMMYNPGNPVDYVTNATTGATLMTL